MHTGFMNKPGRYLALTPPINGGSAAIGSPYFRQTPGQQLFQSEAQSFGVAICDRVFESTASAIH
jgi:hypothetical protein